jgi:hypothetical protein
MRSKRKKGRRKEEIKEERKKERRKEERKEEKKIDRYKERKKADRLNKLPIYIFINFVFFMLFANKVLSDIKQRL